MPYVSEISRQSPGCLYFLIDQSYSMKDSFGADAGRSKAERLADAINRLLYELTIRCTKSQEEGIRDYYEVGVIGYGNSVGPALGGTLAGQELVPITKIGNNPARVEDRQRKIEDGAGGLVDETVKFPVWFDPVAQNGTPMCRAFQQAHVILENWVKKHQDSFPPIVINITDGEATDGDPLEPAEMLKKLTTRDGNLLFFNLHLSSQKGTPILYPETEDGLPDECARKLFLMSSILPPHMREAAGSEGYAAGAQSWDSFLMRI